MTLDNVKILGRSGRVRILTHFRGHQVQEAKLPTDARTHTEFREHRGGSREAGRPSTQAEGAGVDPGSAHYCQ